MPFSVAILQYIERLALVGPHIDNVRQLLEVPLRYLKARQGDYVERSYPLITAKLIEIWGEGYIRQVINDVTPMDRHCRLVSEEVFRTVMFDLERTLSGIKTIDGDLDERLEARHSFAALQTILNIDSAVEGMMRPPTLKGPVMRTCMTARQRFYRAHHANFEWKL